jgi:hypothetical protein
MRPYLRYLISLAIFIMSGVTVAQQSVPTADADSLSMLALRLSSPVQGTSKEWRAGLLSSYEGVYGDISNAPKSWDALIRRAIVCDANDLRDCAKSSFTALDQIGGIASLQINTLPEINRFKMSTALLLDELYTARVRIEAPASPPDVQPRASAVKATSLTPASADNNGEQSTAWQYVQIGSVSALSLCVAGFVLLAWMKKSKKRPAQHHETFNEPVAVAPTEPEKIIFTRELVDALNQAETDISFVLETSTGTIKQQHHEVLTQWKAAVKDGRRKLSDDLEQAGFHAHLKPIIQPGPEEVTDTFGRLIEHAELFCVLLHTQNRAESALFHWSKQLPMALTHIHWALMTKRFEADVKAKPKVLMNMTKAPVTMQDSSGNPDAFFRKAAMAVVSAKT